MKVGSLALAFGKELVRWNLRECNLAQDWMLSLKEEVQGCFVEESLDPFSVSGKVTRISTRFLTEVGTSHAL